ncbi:CYFA0S01e14334g1_1 [Cyberlindnera fabianii]|uniref:CYFA0S01e14334g1_1 n=1 Tax=Cyberlindnera fabianii TaxID=36022 RepID=A0A061AQL3_CYBFA|nr:CYFA0S01e14334g1_1 [Cyberlindnera fabianii]
MNKLRPFLWGTPPSDPKEARLLFKIDWFVLSYVCSLYWVNYLDRTNVANAYVSGMKEDLEMEGNEFNVINTVFTVGYIVGMIPNNLILLKVRPKFWLSFCCFGWGMLTLALYKVTNYKQICVIRFFQALFESTTFSGSHLILGSWYNSEDIVDPDTGRVQSSELTKRTAIFTASGLLGSIFSSFMQAAIYTNMDGLNGIAGWRWLFIIDAVITIPISIYGFIFFPDTPETCTAFYFSQEEINLAIERVQNPHMDQKFDWSLLGRVLGRWHWWGFSILWILGGENESFCTNSLFAIWLKNRGYSVQDANRLPMGVYAVGIISTFICALYVDHTGGRYHWHVAIFISVCLLVSGIMVLVNPLHAPVQFFAQYLSGVSYAGQASFFAWANVVTRHDLQERAMVLASMNMFSSSVNAWYSLLLYRATTAPEFRPGAIALLCTAVLSAAVAGSIRMLQLRDEKNVKETVSEEKVNKSEETDDKKLLSPEPTSI